MPAERMKTECVNFRQHVPKWVTIATFIEYTVIKPANRSIFAEC